MLRGTEFLPRSESSAGIEEGTEKFFPNGKGTRVELTPGLLLVFGVIREGAACVVTIFLEFLIFRSGLNIVFFVALMI